MDDVVRAGGRVASRARNSSCPPASRTHQASESLRLLANVGVDQGVKDLTLALPEPGHHRHRERSDTVWPSHRTPPGDLAAILVPGPVRDLRSAAGQRCDDSLNPHRKHTMIMKNS